MILVLFHLWASVPQLMDLDTLGLYINSPNGRLHIENAHWEEHTI